MTRHIVDRLERMISRHVLESMPSSAQTHLADKRVSDLLIEYGTWRDRFVSPTPRTVKLSRELKASPKATKYQAGLDTLKAKLEAGADISAHLSDRMNDPFSNTKAPSLEHRSDRDTLLSDWGLHHLHLTDRPNASTVKRGDDVLLAAFTDSTAYFVTIVPHPTKQEGWARQDVFDILARNWAKDNVVLPLKNAVGIHNKYSDDDLRSLRNSGITSFMAVDGRVYASGRLGQTAAGTPMMITRRVNDTMWHLKPWRDDFDDALAKAGISEPAYWTPATQLTVPGFEEWAGFSATLSTGPIFVRAARIV